MSTIRVGNIGPLTGNTSVIADPGGAGGMSLVSMGPVSASGTSVDFTGIPSWARRITVLYQSLSTSSTASPIIRLGTSGGIVSSGYSSAAGYLYQQSAPDVFAQSTAFLIGLGGTANQTYSGQMTISLMNPSTNLWISSGIAWRTDASQLWPACGYVSLSATLTTVRITTTSSDTLDAGSINVMYE